jgi:flagellar hook protein FlgE
MFSGVSGLRAHQTRMDVIGNNVANVNTVGFKSGRVTFQEIFSQTLSGASAPDSATGRGGTNPKQIGLGLSIGAVDTVMTRGSLQTTDNPTDLSIEGEGFFVCKGGSADTFKFTRAGNFGIDKLGNLVTGGGLNVYGWQEYKTEADGTYTFNTEAEIEPINLYSDVYNMNKKMISAKATSSIVSAGNLDASKAVPTPAVSNPLTSSTAQFTMPMTVYDSLGNSYDVNVYFTKTNIDSNDVTTWSYTVPSLGTSASVTQGYDATSNYGTVSFDSQGRYMSSTTTNNHTLVPTLTLAPNPPNGASDMVINLDFSKLTSYSADSSAKPTEINGYSTGTLTTFSIGSDGMITGVYSNGQQQPLGLIALAGFENPAGLQKVGSNLYIPTTNSGEFEKGVKAGSEGVGSLSPGTLEMSNVDLSQEFTNMIITQRGFQANSRIITTSDEMLQELVNLKR